MIAMVTEIEVNSISVIHVHVRFDISSFTYRLTDIAQSLAFVGQKVADRSQYQWNTQITSWKVLCIFIHSLKHISKLSHFGLTRSFTDTSQLNIIRAHVYPCP